MLTNRKQVTALTLCVPHHDSTQLHRMFNNHLAHRPAKHKSASKIVVKRPAIIHLFSSISSRTLAHPIISDADGRSEIVSPGSGPPQFHGVVPSGVKSELL